jgi:hypothetical protein
MIETLWATQHSFWHRYLLHPACKLKYLINGLQSNFEGYMSKIPFPPVGCGRDSLELGHQHTNEPSCKNKKYFVTWDLLRSISNI